MSYKPILPQQEKPELPFRVQRKIDIYKKVGLEYLWSRDTKDRQEVGFYQLEKLVDAKREKPTLRREIVSIYRVRDREGKEWIVWYETKIVQDRTLQDVPFDDL